MVGYFIHNLNLNDLKEVGTGKEEVDGGGFSGGGGIP